MENNNYIYNMFNREPINKKYLKPEQYVVKGYGKAYKIRKVVKAFNNYNELGSLISCKDKIYADKIMKLKREKKYKEIKRRSYSEKEKQFLFLRQFNYFCGNYPNSPLSKILRFHCSSYDNPLNLFKLQNQQFLEIEHLIQFSKGGKDDSSNCYLLCSNCHSVKTAMERKKEKLIEMEKIFKEEGKKHTEDFRNNFMKNMEYYILENEYYIRFPNEVDKFKDIVISIKENDACIIKHTK